MNYQIEPLQPKDRPQVRSIYTESIKTGIATFETKRQTGKTGIPVAYHPAVLSHGMENIFMAG